MAVVGALRPWEDIVVLIERDIEANRTALERKALDPIGTEYLRGQIAGLRAVLQHSFRNPGEGDAPTFAGGRYD